MNVQEFQVDHTSVLERLNMSNLMRYFFNAEILISSIFDIKETISERMSVNKYFNDG